MYVIKVGNYYVKSVLNNGDIVLSKEIMRGFNEVIATTIAERINGEAVKMEVATTNE